MNILWLSHIVPYPPKGGSLQRSFNLLKEVASRHRVLLLAFNQKVLLPTEDVLAESVEALKEYCDLVKIFDIACERSRIYWYWLLFKNLFSSLPYNVKQFQSGHMTNAIKKVIRIEKIDLVYFDTIDLAQYIDDIGQIDAILNHHNVESLLLLRRAKSVKSLLPKLYLYIQGKKLRKYEAKASRWFRLNLAVSLNDKDQLLRISPEAKFEVIPNGVDTEYFRPSNSVTRGKNLIFVGGMTWFPNLDAVSYFLDEIWPLAKKAIPDLRLTLVGRQPLKRVDRMSRDENIDVLGFVDDVRPYIAEATAFIVPIRIGGGTRLKILDAFACGKAVVSTSLGCEGIDVILGKHILIGDTPREFADQIIRVCKDERLMKSLGTAGRKLVERKYDWKIIGRHLNNIIQNQR